MNLFVYGILMSKFYRRDYNYIEYDYIKGYSLREIIIDDETYLESYENINGIISGQIILGISDEYLKTLDEYEGDTYKRIKIKTEINKSPCEFYCSIVS